MTRPASIPRWDPIRKRWQLNAQKNGVRRPFYSSKPGRSGSSEVKRKRQLWLDSQADKSTMRFEKAWELYLEDIKARTGPENVSQNTKMGRLYVMPRLKAKKMYAITEQDWQDCISHAKGRVPLSRHTLADIRGVITAFCHFAKRSRMIENRPDDLRIPNDAPVKGKSILQPDQLKRLFEPSDEWFINAWRFMAATGLRPGEVYGLRNEDIKNGVLTIRRSLSHDGNITQGKNKNARREIKLHGLAQEILSEQRMKVMHLNSPWTFCNATGGLTLPKGIYDHWKRFATSRGIQASPYGLRHTFVSLTKNEMPPELVKRLVGHSESMDTFGVYGHDVDGELDRAAKMLDDVFMKYFSS